MTRYLDPTNDIAFKKLFSQEKPLISFLNAMLELKAECSIQKIEFLPEEEARIKTTLLGVKCTDETGKQYIVEIQNRKVPVFVKREQLYPSHSYASQFVSEEDDSELRSIILLCIANHTLFPNKARIISRHLMLGECALQDFSCVFVELPKFTKKENELVTLQDKWLYFFNNWNSSQKIPSLIQEEEMIEAYHILEKPNWRPPLKPQLAPMTEGIALYAQERLKSGHSIEEIAKDFGLA